MRDTFIDSSYLIALHDRNDQWHEQAQFAGESLGIGVSFVTTYDVLSEFLASFSRAGAYMRARAVEMVNDIMDDPDVTLVPQSHDLFTRGLQLYASRPDKRYSLTDCISMTVMRELDITEVLTHDRDFENEGFIRLIR